MLSEESLSEISNKSINSEDSISIIKSKKNKKVLKKGFNVAMKNGKFNINFNTITKTSFSNEEMNLECVIENLSKENRTSKECQSIMKFLEGTELVKKFKLDRMEENHLIKLLYFVSMCAEYEFLKKDDFLFRQGDPGDKFFIILKGEIRVLKHKEKLIRLTGEEYLKKVIAYYNNSEKDLLEKTLKANKDIYPIFDKDVPRLEEICFRIKLRKILLVNPSIIDIDKLFQEYEDKFKPKDFDIDLKYLMNIQGDNEEKAEENLKLHFSIKRLSTLSTRTELTRYRYLENTFESKFVKLYEYEELVKLQSGKYFGDYAMDACNPIRTATIQANKDTHLCYIYSDHYRDYILAEKQKLKIKEIKFFVECFLYNLISIPIFEKKCFSNFTYHELFRNETLYFEDDSLDYLYFIKEGEIELSLNKNLLELHVLIKTLITKTGNKNKIKYDIHNEPTTLLKELVKRRKIKGFIYGAKETLGLEERLFGFNRIFEAKIISEKAKFYKIERSKLEKIFEEEKALSLKYEQTCKTKIQTIIYRLIDIQKIIIDFTEKQVNQKHKLETLSYIRDSEQSLKFKITQESRSPKIISQIHIDPRKYSNSLVVIKNQSSSTITEKISKFIKEKEVKKESKSNDKLIFKNLMLSKYLHDSSKENINENRIIKKLKSNLKKYEDSNISKMLNDNLMSLNLTTLNSNYISDTIHVPKINLLHPEHQLFSETIKSSNEHNNFKNLNISKIASLTKNKKKRIISKSIDVSKVKLYNIFENPSHTETYNSPIPFKNLKILKKKKISNFKDCVSSKDKFDF